LGSLFPGTTRSCFVSYAFKEHQDSLRDGPPGQEELVVPYLSQDLLLTVVELMCYFGTAVGVLLTIIVGPRA